MHIAVVTRMLQRGKLEGIGNFAHQTLQRLVVSRPEHQFTFLFDRPFADEFLYSPNVQPVLLKQFGGAARHPLQIAYWHQLTLRKFLESQKPDLLVSPDGSIPLNCPVPSLAIIHDINFEHFPGDLPFLFRKYYKLYFPLIAENATRIATVSEFCKNDIVSKYHVPTTKVDVIYNGVSEIFRPLTEEEILKTRNKFSSGQRYFLFLGSIHGRKNVDGLIQAYDEFRNRTTKDTHHPKLIIAGAKRWSNSEVKKAHQNSPYKDDIIFTGRVSDEDILLLMGSAYAFVLVSKFEGFGIPIVEAMQCGVPVICSNGSAFPEVAGNAALMVDPFSKTAIADALEKIMTDELLRETLINRGFQQAQKFTWSAAAEKLWKSFELTVHTKN